MSTTTDEPAAASSICLSLRLQGEDPTAPARACRYRLAGRFLEMDTPLPELAPFEVERQDAPHLRRLPSPPPKPATARLIYAGPGWIGNQWRDVECWGAAAGFWIGVDGAGLFWVSATGLSMAHVSAGSPVQASTVRETVLGPVLILALALQGTWCLHASAVALEHGAVAFVGESGSGKSTLAASLGAGRPGLWQRIGDDILPVRAGPDGLLALPRYPQLKLSAGAQPSLSHPERILLRAVYVLEEQRRQEETAIEIRTLPPAPAALAFVRHTIAARLFDKPLLARHLAFCSEVAAGAAVRRLRYPHEIGLLPQVRTLIEADLRTRPGPT